MARTARVGLCAGLCFVVSCAQPGEQPSSAPRWEGDIETVVRENCAGCHSGVEGSSAPDLSTYSAITSCREDGLPWTIPGDRSSLLLLALERPDHRDVVDAGARDRLARWIVEGGTALRSLAAHPAGFASRSQEEVFHGAQLRRTGHVRLLDPQAEGACVGCHEPGGGRSALACKTCHTVAFSAPTCDGCHGAAGDPRPQSRPCDPPARREAVGAHRFHFVRTSTGPYPSIECRTCHVVPNAIDASGHLGDGTPRAEVQFDAEQRPSASYDPTTHTCADTGCHFNPVAWTKSPDTGDTCARCHGNPPVGHAQRRCATCHFEALDATSGLPNDRHMDGVVQVGSQCNSCHGLPPTSGAHVVHVQSDRLTQPVACVDCHVVPTSRDAPGHIDTDLPAEVQLSGVRAAGGGRTTPAFDPAGRTCSGVGCHGAHLDGGPERSPKWEDSPGLVCGTCHGLPPATIRDGSVPARIHWDIGTPPGCGCHQTPGGDQITTGTTILTPEGRRVHANGVLDCVDSIRLGACQ